MLCSQRPQPRRFELRSPYVAFVFLISPHLSLFRSIYFLYPKETAAEMFLFLVPAPASNVSQFTQVCASIGQQAQCCVVPVVSFLFFECYADAWNWANQSDAVGPSPALPEPPGPVSGDSFPSSTIAIAIHYETYSRGEI